MTSYCPYCGKPHFNFGDDEEGVEMWINEPNQCGAEIGEYGVPNYCYNCGVAIRNAGCGGALG